MMEPLSISRALASFVADTRFEALDQHALAQTRYALLDQLGVSLAAGRLGEGCLSFSKLVNEQGSRAESTVLVTGSKASAAQAAFANGALSHALDFEDAHDAALVHPNAATIPAALAVAEARGDVSGRELLTAIAIGCEVVCRLGLALRVPLDDYGWYPPPILSAFGATAAAARLCKLNSQQVLDAFSLTLSQATCSAEIKYNPESQIRAVRDAFPAQAGVQSAQLAGYGVTGFEQPFEGKAGFFAAFARGQYEPAVLTRDLGERFEIAELSFKAWPSCRGTHAFIEAALTLAKKHRLQIPNIARIDVYGHRLNRMLAEPVASKRQPETAIDAKFSIPFCVASALIHGDLDLRHFEAKARLHSEVLALAAKVHYHEDDKFRERAAMTAGRTVISLADGKKLEADIDRPYGSPQRPLSDAKMVKKFIRCCQFAVTPVLDVQSLAKSILSLETADNLQRRLFKHLQVHSHDG